MEAVHTMQLSLPEVRKKRLVIALDYGTTYTGVAYTLTTEPKANLDDILPVQIWGNGVSNEDKIPSAISYSRGIQWGGNIDTGLIAMVHTKLQLQLRSTSHELDYCCQALQGMNDLDFQSLKSLGSLPPYTWKSPETIVEDFLSRMFDSLKTVHDVFNRDVLDDTPVDIVATIPAGWSYEAKNALFCALTRAGFSGEEFPSLSNVWLISEPEAAAIFTARSINLADSRLGRGRRNEERLRLNECFVLADAGGGTVDVVSYQVKQLHPKFEISRTTTPQSRECGSIFINIAFKTWLRGILGGHYIHLDPNQPRNSITSFDRENGNMRMLMEKFNTNKKKFTHGYRDMPMTLPGALSTLDLEPHVRQGQIVITYEIMKSFFEPLVNKTFDLIKCQLQELYTNGLQRRCRYVFLVGGFAESPYLNESLTTSLELHGIQVQRAPNSLTAVVRGAAIVGVENLSNCKMLACPRSYGIAIDETYSPILHHIKDRVEDPINGSATAKDQLKWLIKKGDLILSDAPKMRQKSITVEFEEFSPKTGKIPIYAFDYDNLPSRLSDSLNELTPIRTVEYDLNGKVQLSQLPVHQLGRAKPVYSARLDLTLQLEPTRLLVRLAWKDTQLYDDEIVL